MTYPQQTFKLRVEFIQVVWLIRVNSVKEDKPDLSSQRTKLILFAFDRHR